VATPQITAVEPAAITTGGTVIVRGSNFSPIADHNAVLFDGVRGAIQSASETELRVTVPQCLPNRTVAVTVALGFAVSASQQVQATGTGGTTLTLAPGGSATFADPAALSCIRLPGGIGNAVYLLTVHNVASTHAPPVRFELRVLTAGTVTNIVGTPSPTVDFAGSWEMRLRRQERALLRDALDEGGPAAFAAAARIAQVPEVGQGASFNVLTPTNEFVKVNATARIVEDRVVIYLDDTAPANGFSPQDLQRFADLFDNPIYPTDVAVFGEPSDIDNNQRVAILFTPRVNALTPRGQGNSFAAAYFYGCDLLARSRCSGSNLGEIFYAMVPDPTGQFSDVRTVATVLNVVPPVLAHEFQHMIHFARRDLTTDALWLSEALAHSAEELVGDALIAQGATALGASFKAQNYTRAQRYLAASSSTSLLAEDSPGSLELRGGAWLLLKHARGHYGGDALLTRLTASTRSGVANLTQETGSAWSTLLRDFGVAIWADGAPDFPVGVVPDSARQVFRDFDPRAVLAGVPQSGGYALQARPLTWGDFAEDHPLAAASQLHFRLAAPADGGPNLNFVLSGPRGAPFDQNAVTQLTILRMK
jgi:hypothetical protein